MTRRPLVPNPCHEDWDLLSPEDRGHFCTVCETKVWDLSGLTKEEAEAFLRAREGEDLCVSYRENSAGEVVHRPSPIVPLGRLVRRLPAAAGLSLALAACSPGDSGAQQEADSTREAKPATETAPEPEPEPEVSPEAEPEAEPESEVEPVAEPESEAEPEAEQDPKPEPEPKPRPDDELHVKGKWAPADALDDEGEDPPIKKGKVAPLEP